MKARLIFDKKFPNNTTRHFDLVVGSYISIQGSVTIVSPNTAMVVFCASDNIDKFNTCFCDGDVFELTTKDIENRITYTYPERFL